LDIFWRQDIETVWRQVMDKMEQVGDKFEAGEIQVADTRQVRDRFQTGWGHSKDKKVTG
jgi:hypothetical protein